MGEAVAVRFAADTDIEPDIAALSEAERWRLDRLRREDDRRSYLAAHLLVRECVAELVGGAAAEVEIRQRCGRCGSDRHGAPYVVGSDLRVSLSHTRGHVAAVAATGPCGVDVEVVPGGPAPAGTLTPREAEWVGEQAAPGVAFARLWTRKEALVKAGLAELDTIGGLCVLTGDAPAEEIGGLRLAEWVAPDGRVVGAWASDGRR
ncbi:4'-phosphopantetheinyl transferase family protein [Nocardioides insulae]|uniref:4'-phosphopantetheinyl transferase family protein n=1 Tax=Nocardioides insulae TaxID=394734 RepID=UPI0003F7EDB2|nr:4'-phosphopantetheinyl transferase superfamily protein [Nocardioides insulae]